MNVDQFAEENGVVFEDDYLDEEPDEVIICEIVKELISVLQNNPNELFRAIKIDRENL